MLAKKDSTLLPSWDEYENRKGTERVDQVVTYFVVLGFSVGKGGLWVADEPREVHGASDDKCIAVAKKLRSQKDGVIAFSRSGDPTTGDWEDARILWQDGVVPEEVFAMAG